MIAASCQNRSVQEASIDVLLIPVYLAVWNLVDFVVGFFFAIMVDLRIIDVIKFIVYNFYERLCLLWLCSRFGDLLRYLLCNNKVTISLQIILCNGKRTARILAGFGGL